MLDPLCSSCLCIWKSDCSFAQVVLKLEYPQTLCTYSCYMAAATWSCYRLRTCSVCTIQPCISLQCGFIWSHTLPCKVYVCFTVACHLHFWQNDLDLLCDTAATHGWKGYKIYKGQHINLTLVKLDKKCSCQELNPRLSDQESSALPLSYPHSPSFRVT